MDSLAATTLQTTNVSPASARLIDILSRYTAFPRALLAVVCERRGLDIASLELAQMPALVHPLALQMALFNDVDAGFALKRELLVALCA